MKLFVIVILVTFSCGSQAQFESIYDTRTSVFAQCLRRLDVSQDEFEERCVRGINPEICGCIDYCIEQQSELLDENNTPIVDKFIERTPFTGFDSVIIEQILSTCNARVASITEDCARTAERMRCIRSYEFGRYNDDDDDGYDDDDGDDSSASGGINFGTSLTQLFSYLLPQLLSNIFNISLN